MPENKPTRGTYILYTTEEQKTKATECFYSLFPKDRYFIAGTLEVENIIGLTDDAILGLFNKNPEVKYMAQPLFYMLYPEMGMDGMVEIHLSASEKLIKSLRRGTVGFRKESDPSHK